MGRSTAKKKTAEAAGYGSDLEYMRDELEWLELRCRRLAVCRELERAGDTSGGSTRRWGEPEATPATLRSRVKTLRGREDGLRRQIDARRAHNRDGRAPALALDRLCAMYGLDDFERTIVVMAAAVGFSRTIEDLYGEIAEQPRFGALTVQTVFDFMELDFAERIERRGVFARDARLVANDLVTVELSGRYNAPGDLLDGEVRISTRVFGYLVGNERIGDEFLEFSSVEEPRATFEQVVLPPADKQRILSVIERHDEYLACRREWGFDDVITYGRGVLMLFYGKPGTGKTMTAHAVAHAMQKRVLNVDIPTFVNHRDADRFLPALFREARIQDAILFFDECETLFGERRQGNTLMTLLLTEIERFEGVAILATNLPGQLDEALDRRILVKIAFPEPDPQARKLIWQQHLPAKAPLAGDVDLDTLASRYEMTGGYIKNSVLVALADAVHSAAPGAERTITMEALEQAAREQMRRPAEDAFAHGMTQPRVRLADVMLDEPLREQIDELVDTARNRRLVLERWGIGEHLTYGQGVAALFWGPPGTGKTLCAQAISGELGRPLLVASASTLQSKWVGETERNLERLFRQAQQDGAVLFLDEADSLLCERGTARASRHDDAAVNTLLTLVERFDGLVLMATNRPLALDPALRRRLSYNLEFRAPSAPVREAIWRRLLGPKVPTDGALDFEALASRPLTGALIKNAVFKAAFRAARRDVPVSMALLEQAAREEAGTDQERAIGF